MNKVFGFLGATVVILLIVHIIADPLTSSIVEVVEGETHNVTPDTDGEASVTLSRESWYSSTRGISALNDGGDTLTIDSLGDNRKTLEVSGLSGTAALDIDVTYEAEKEDDIGSIILRMVPFLMLLGGIGAATATLVSSVRGGIGGSTDMGYLQAGLVILIGVVLLPVVNNFADMVSEGYGDMPGYMAIGILVPFVKVAYIFGLLGSAFGSFGPSVKTAFQNFRG